MRNSLLYGMGILLVATTLGACSSDSETAEDTAADPAAAPAPAAPAAGSADLVAQGMQLYSSAPCVACHGADAKGTALAPDLTDGQWLWVEPGQQLNTRLAEVIKTGVPEPKTATHPTPMPPMGGATLTDEQVNAVVAYLVSLNP